ncbi:MAG TPA: hypothetical protein VK594_24890, partial [Streptosporangiaceae bacterium]|nr:hypothetical protein [Streptosporangiaceae bacterium]
AAERRAGTGGASATPASLMPEAGGLDAAFTPAGRRPNALKPGIHCVRTHWIRGFIAFLLVRRTRTVMLMVPV